MTPHFGTYHWRKNTVQGCQNTVQGCKIAFGTPFLATPIGVALKPFSKVWPLKGFKKTKNLPISPSLIGLKYKVRHREGRD